MLLAHFWSFVALHCIHEPQNFGLGENLLGLLRGGENSIHPLIGCRNSALLKQKITFERPLSGPISMICSSPNKCEGTPL